MRILFQGDSITDAGRDRTDCHNMGNGYPKYASKYLTDYFPEIDFEFINYGVSGDELEDLIDRIDEEIVQVQPDIISIMIGVNDTWHNVDKGAVLPNKTYEKQYRQVLDAIKDKTNAKIVMLEQYLLPAEDKEYLRNDIDQKIQITRKLAREYADLFIPFDGILAAQCVSEDYTNLSDDGVHPNPGHGSDFIGRIYADSISEIIEEVYNKGK